MALKQIELLFLVMVAQVVMESSILFVFSGQIYSYGRLQYPICCDLFNHRRNMVFCRKLVLSWGY